MIHDEVLAVWHLKGGFSKCTWKRVDSSSGSVSKCIWKRHPKGRFLQCIAKTYGEGTSGLSECTKKVTGINNKEILNG